MPLRQRREEAEVSEDFYAILGVDRGASQAEIKKAYRVLARKYHPDKNPGDTEAETRFKDAAEAYRVLGDEDLRAQYDQHGTTAPAMPPGFGSEGFEGEAQSNEPNDVFDELFGGRGREQRSHHQGRARRPRGSGPTRPAERSTGAQRHRSQPRSAPRAQRSEGGRRFGSERGSDLRYTLDLEFEDAAMGTEERIIVPRQERCETCGGTGASPGSAPLRCNHCNGTGTVRMQQGFFDVADRCTVCSGTGKLVPQNCVGCGGGGVVEVDRSIPVQVPPGVDSGTRLKIGGEGAPGANGGPPGDLYVVIQVKPHPIFERENDDILTEVPITIAQASLGTQIEVPTLEGVVRMRIPPGSQPGRVFRLKGKGFPSLDGRRRGDQRVRVVIETPTYLSGEQRELLERFAELEARVADSFPRVQEYRSLMRSLYR